MSVFANVLRSGISQYEKCPPNPPTSHLVDNFTPTLKPFTIRLPPKGNHNAYIYKYFYRYILLRVYKWTLLFQYFFALKCSQKNVGIVVVYPEKPCGIWLTARHAMCPLNAMVVDKVDTFKTIHYTIRIPTNTERIRLCSQMTNKNTL